MPFSFSVDANKLTATAFDNFDHNESTLSGIGSIHGTAAVIFQRKTNFISDQ